MRILLVDDEQPARERLKRLLADIEGVELVGEAEDGPKAVELIEREQPDLLLSARVDFFPYHVYIAFTTKISANSDAKEHICPRITEEAV